MSGQHYSLRRRIVALVSIPVMLSGAAIAALALNTSWHEIEEVYDAQLIHAAKVLRLLTRNEFGKREKGTIDLVQETEDFGYKYEKNIAFRVWRKDQLLIRSNNALVFGKVHMPPGLSDLVIDGEKWRFFVFVDPGADMTVETAERYEIRYELIRHLLFGLLLPGSLFIPVVLVLVWYGTSRGLRPLDTLSRDVDSRHSDDLGNIEAGRTPEEIEPLVNALNRLLSRLKEALDRERDFTDYAAHELRTPLAAIKTQAQALRPRLEEMPESRQSLGNLLASIDRANHLVDKLLAFSRLQKESLKTDTVILPDLLEGVVANLAPEAIARGQELTLDASRRLVVRADRHALEIMVKNLVENAIKYTPAGSDIGVSLDTVEGRITIRVVDNGPGIHDADKERVLRRFYRIENSETTGSGLGLAIVKWIADRHGATLALSDVEPTGLRCTVTFPAAHDA